MSGFSKSDIKSNVRLPKLDSNLLAYETGVHVGDGSLQIIDRGTHSTRYFGHSEDDIHYYSSVLIPVIKELYNKEVKIGIRSFGKVCYLSVCSKRIALFKKNILGLSVGNKAKMNNVPSFIRRSKELTKHFLRGVADTDFTLYFTKGGQNGFHKYPEISCTMSNKMIIAELSSLISQLGFEVKTKCNIKRKRNNKINTEHRLTIYGKKQLERWIKFIGFDNTKHFTKYLVWKRYGFCPPRLSTNERILILSDKINPNKYYTSLLQPKAKTP